MTNYTGPVIQASIPICGLLPRGWEDHEKYLARLGGESDNPFEALPDEASIRASDAVQRAGSCSAPAKRKNAGSHNRRAAARKRARMNEGPSGIQVRDSVIAKYVENAPAIELAYDAASFSSTSGAYGAKSLPGLKRVFNLEDLVGPRSKHKFRLQKWTGRSMPLVDANQKIIGAVVAPPKDPTWAAVQTHVADKLNAAGPRLNVNRSQDHRRGKFPAMPYGISHGQGQEQPMLLRQDSTNRAILEDLISDPAMIRVAGFQSAAFAAWAPKVYDYYATTIESLLKHDAALQRNFANSVFACTSINFGPRTVCYRHNDSGNLPHGLCAITAFGSFDYTTSGHLILWDLELVLEFPAGSTIIIPSASLKHSNVGVKKYETRFSMTQYTSGSIFRWVDHGFQKEADFWESLDDEAAKLEGDKRNQRVANGLSLFSTYVPRLTS